MPLTLDATVGGPNANAYLTLQEVRDRAAYRIGSARFLALTDDQTIQTLVMGTKELDTLEEDPGFIGERYSEDQALAWPRDDGDLPEGLLDALLELAISYAPAFASGFTGDPLNPSEADAQVKVKEVGPIKTEWFAARTSEKTGVDRFPGTVVRFLQGLLCVLPTSGWGAGTAARGS